MSGILLAIKIVATVGAIYLGTFAAFALWEYSLGLRSFQCRHNDLFVVGD